MTEEKKFTNKEIQAMRKKGKQLAHIAAETGMDKMEVRDICLKANKSKPKAAVQEPEVVETVVDETATQ